MELLFSVFSYYIIDRSINNQTGAARIKVKHDIDRENNFLPRIERTRIIENPL